MTITVYNFPDDPKTLDKSGGVHVGTYTGTINSDIENDSPEVVVNGTVTVGNMAYIDTLDMWYEVTEKTVLREGLTSLQCVADPCTRYASAIKNSACVCERSTAKYNGQINDPKYPTRQRQTVEVKKIFQMSNADAEVMAYIE